MVFQAKGLKAEATDDTGDVECYTPKELRSMLERASRLPEPPKDGEEPERDFGSCCPILVSAAWPACVSRRSSGSTSKTCFACLTTSK